MRTGKSTPSGARPPVVPTGPSQRGPGRALDVNLRGARGTAGNSESPRRSLAYQTMNPAGLNNVLIILVQFTAWSSASGAYGPPVGPSYTSEPGVKVGLSLPLGSLVARTLACGGSVALRLVLPSPPGQARA